TEDMLARLFHQQSKILAIQVAQDRVLAVEPGAAEGQRERLQTQYPSQRRWIHDHPLAASRERVAVKHGAVARLQKLRRLFESISHLAGARDLCFKFFARKVDPLSLAGALHFDEYAIGRHLETANRQGLRAARR